MTASGSDGRPDWPRLYRWDEMSRWRRYAAVASGVLGVVLIGFLLGVEIHETGRVWPAVRYVLLSLPLLGVLFLVIGFYKVRRGGAALLSVAGLAALLAGIWWAVPAERDLVLTVGELVTGLGAGALVFVPAVRGRIATALGTLAGLLGLLYGISWAFPTLSGPARTFVDAGIEGVLWVGTSGFVLYAAERAGLLTLPREGEDADTNRASAG